MAAQERRKKIENTHRAMVDVSQCRHGTSGLGDFGSWENDVCMCLCGWVCGCHWSGSLSLSKVQQWPSVWDDKTRVLISLSRCVCVHMWVICDSRCQVLVTYAQQGTIICWREKEKWKSENCAKGEKKNSLEKTTNNKNTQNNPPKKRSEHLWGLVLSAGSLADL